jgi:hypothetical protein
MVGRLSWVYAESDLDDVDPAVVAQIRHSAEQLLHSIPPRLHPPSDEGISDGIMWHRAKIQQEPEEQPDGPQNYFLFYRNGTDHEFEILGVCSIYQVANRWATWMSARTENPYGEPRPA